uniref:Uncharacterized protein n=1 Tax=Anguilla anguilla TaxID=7936 RepID=A0A0E9UY50_ANGAN
MGNTVLKLCGSLSQACASKDSVGPFLCVCLYMYIY